MRSFLLSLSLCHFGLCTAGIVWHLVSTQQQEPAARQGASSQPDTCKKGRRSLSRTCQGCHHSVGTRASSWLSKLLGNPPGRDSHTRELPALTDRADKSKAGLRRWSKFPELQPHVTPQPCVLEVLGNQQLSASLFQVIFLCKTCWTQLPTVSSDASLLPPLVEAQEGLPLMVSMVCSPRCTNTSVHTCMVIMRVRCLNTSSW